ncbi:radical SAM protein [Candidatus Woesearchaeota archaeon]|nr:radical SAM protein [Candidatus Woesearchaeota archaeon]
MGKRVDIKTGFICNNNCRFCVQADNKCKGNRSLEGIKKDLEDSRKRCEGVVLTGGEVTIRKDFLDIVEYAKSLGYKTIQIQTNGRMFSSLNFCKKAIKAGATEFSPAIHGYCAEQHDFLTRAPGSFRQTVQGIKNLKSLGQYVLTNTVVVKPNYRNLPDIAKLLVNLNVDQFQFAFVHPMGNAWNNFDSIVPSISLAAPYIHNGLQIGIDAGKKVMAEAMPYCQMAGYEAYISEKVIPETEIRGQKHQNTDSFTKQRKEKGKAKFPQCDGCGYNPICEGPWKEYPEKLGNKEFNTIKKHIAMVEQKPIFEKLSKLETEEGISGNILKATAKELFEELSVSKILIKEALLSFYPVAVNDKGFCGTCLCIGGWKELENEWLRDFYVDSELNLKKDGFTIPFRNNARLFSLYTAALNSAALIKSSIIKKNTLEEYPQEKSAENPVISQVGFALHGFVEYSKAAEIHIFDRGFFTDHKRKQQIEKEYAKFKKETGKEAFFYKEVKEDIIKKSDVLVLSGSTIPNGTFESIIRNALQAKMVFIFGRSALLYPKALFRKGVSIITTTIPPKNLIDVAKSNYEKYISMDQPGSKIILGQKNAQHNNQE